MEICEYGPEDVDDALKELWLGLAHEMFEIEHFVLPLEANADKWVSFVRDGLAKKTSFLIVAKFGNKPVGFAFSTVYGEHPLKVSELVGTINDVYVLPMFRGKGIGKKLIIETLNKMRDNGVKAVRLTVLIENKAAIKLYEKLGFKLYQHGMIKALR